MQLVTGDEWLEVPPSVQSVIDQLGSYPAVKCIKNVSTGQHAAIVEVEWAVNLPNRFRKQGISDAGVRELESVYWRLPFDYPRNAPSVRLRPDFPTNLPHIFSHTAGEFVRPCISELPPIDLLHSMGLFALFDATCQWLNNAAANELHCPVQGWEPVRRDNIAGLIFADTHAIRDELTSSTNVVKYYSYRYSRLDSSEDLLMGELRTPSLGSPNTALKKNNLGIEKDTSIRNTPGVLFRTEEGKVFDKYQPETVYDFKTLREFATSLGLTNAFDARLKHVLAVSSPQSMRKQDKVPVEEFLVVFAIKRPFDLIGAKSPWELLAYRVSFNLEHETNLSNDNVVRPTQLIEKTSPQLLQLVSGDQTAEPVKLGLLGCGSLGSKVGLHLAKTGCYQFQLVDNDYFGSHNNARHGLIAPDFSNLCFSKSRLLDRQMSYLNVESTPIDKDIKSMGEKPGFSLHKQTDYVLDTTASLPVRYHLSHHCDSLRSRLIQSCLYGKATVGVVAIEGDRRTVRIDDMSAFVNALCIDDDQIKNAMYGENGPQINHFGEGCGSVTTVMNDIDISLMSAALSSRIHDHIKNCSDATDGILHIATLDQTAFDLTWKTFVFPATLVIPANNAFGWNVRVLGSVVKRIEELSNEDLSLENGGVIAGQVCALSKTIYVSHLLDAPKDSVRSRDKFILNVDGLAEEFERIHEQTNGQVTFLGTWHSHTSATPPSTIDIDSLEQLQSNYDLPIVMLTYTGGHIVRVEC